VIAIARDKFLWDQEIREGEVRKEGKEEDILQTAKAVLAEGVEIEIVCKATGLIPEDLT